MASGGCGVAALSSLGSPRNPVLGGVLFREGWVCCGDALASPALDGVRSRAGHHLGEHLTPPAGGHTGLGSFSLMRKRHAWRGGAAGGYPHHAAETPCEAGQGHGEPPWDGFRPLHPVPSIILPCLWQSGGEGGVLPSLIIYNPAAEKHNF